jgi:hypothetical protein
MHTHKTNACARTHAHARTHTMLTHAHIRTHTPAQLPAWPIALLALLAPLPDAWHLSEHAARANGSHGRELSNKVDTNGCRKYGLLLGI